MGEVSFALMERVYGADVAAEAQQKLEASVRAAEDCFDSDHVFTRGEPAVAEQAKQYEQCATYIGELGVYATIHADSIPRITHHDYWDLPELEPEDRTYIRSYEWGTPRQKHPGSVGTLQNIK